ncbi:MAG: hypothetical protein U0169_15550 [Polyangiaceae bacterium]
MKGAFAYVEAEPHARSPVACGHGEGVEPPHFTQLPTTFGVSRATASVARLATSSRDETVNTVAPTTPAFDTPVGFVARYSRNSR